MRRKEESLSRKIRSSEKILLPLLVIAVLVTLYFTYGYFISDRDEIPEEPDIIVTKNQTITVMQKSTGAVLYNGTNDEEALRVAVGSIDKGVILFEQGTYNVASAIDLKSDITLIGNDCSIIGYRIFRITDASNVIIKGFDFSDPDESYARHSGTNSIVEITNSDNCYILDNTFRNFSAYGLYLSTRSPTHHNNRITIKGNRFLDYGYCGIMIGKQASHIFVDDNLFRDINAEKINPNAYGVALAKGSSTYSYSEYIYIRNNTIENNPMWEGIDSHGANHVYILDNTITDCRIPISVAQMNSDNQYPEPVHNVVIKGNYVKGNMNATRQDSGIYVIGGRIPGGGVQPYRDVIIAENTIEDVNNWLHSNDGGIVLMHVDGAQIYKNKISNVGGTGINLAGTNNVQVYKNEIQNLVRISKPIYGMSVSNAKDSYNIEIRDNKVDFKENCIYYDADYAFSRQ
jgi:nitrous oxidase accessory protein NosD